MADSKIRWIGSTGDGRTTLVEWGDNPYTWGDALLAAEVAEVIDGIGTQNRRARQEKLNKFLDDEKKKKRFIRLICRVKGEKVYDDSVEVKNVDIKLEDAELVVEKIMGKKLTLEIKSGV